jgi:hypothetical protein|tara:strand:+ start:139 stop:288 length:150 start_codon:yes stop_codon:yes gene_type:complete
MAITRSQIKKQLEPGLGRGWGRAEKSKFRKVLEKTHGKIYKSSSKKSKV